MQSLHYYYYRIIFYTIVSLMIEENCFEVNEKQNLVFCILYYAIIRCISELV
jgi:hypothetical protein